MARPHLAFFGISHHGLAHHTLFKRRWRAGVSATRRCVSPPRAAPRNLPRYPKRVLTSFYGVVGEKACSHATLLGQPESCAKMGDKQPDPSMDLFNDAATPFKLSQVITRVQDSSEEHHLYPYAQLLFSWPLPQAKLLFRTVASALLADRLACPVSISLSRCVSASQGFGMPMIG